jgi:hypothetical protein
MARAQLRRGAADLDQDLRLLAKRRGFAAG